MATACFVGVAALVGFYDVAVRDVVMAVGAFTLTRLEEVRQEASAHRFDSAPQRAAGRVSA